MDSAEHYLEARRRHRSADHHNHVRALCYFIGGDYGSIKIGHSLYPGSRLESLQSASPIKLRILATALGGVEREMAYHFQFQRLRLQGEWFSRHRVILKEIKRLGFAPESRPCPGFTAAHSFDGRGTGDEIWNAPSLTSEIVRFGGAGV
jgi:hypothetical protein